MKNVSAREDASTPAQSVPSSAPANNLILDYLGPRASFFPKPTKISSFL